jgi:hypothetical protein
MFGARPAYLRIGYRSSAWSPPAGLTLHDILRYEYEELGNNLRVPLDVNLQATRIPATEVIWVARSFGGAKRYDDGYMGAGYKCGVDTHTFDPIARIACDDNEDGVLVIRNPGRWGL